MMSEGEILIDVAALKGKSIMVATPMYGGLGNTMYISSLLRLQSECFRLGIRLEHAFMMNESLIDRARNGLADEFLTKSNADYLLFIDADIQFRPEDILAMMSYDKDLICAPYPKKHISWPLIIDAINNGITDIATLEKLVGEYVFTALDGGTKVNEIIRVREAGTGLMLIKRDVFAKIKEKFPENHYISDASRDVYANKEREMFAFFKTGIVDKRYLSEDYYFCHKWREIGGDVWLFPWAITSHFGNYPFQGSLGTFIDVARKIQENQKDPKKVKDDEKP
jgi:glycosyltransferase involved in cell wall biosynthesis